jgi:hypothetical protein
LSCPSTGPTWIMMARGPGSVFETCPGTRERAQLTARNWPTAARPLTRRGSVSIAGPPLVQVSPNGVRRQSGRRPADRGPAGLRAPHSERRFRRSPQGGPGPGTAPTAYVRAHGARPCGWRCSPAIRSPGGPSDDPAIRNVRYSQRPTGPRPVNGPGGTGPGSQRRPGAVAAPGPPPGAE